MAVVQKLTFLLDPVPVTAKSATGDAAQHAPGHDATAAAATNDAHAERRHEHGDEAAQQYCSASDGQQSKQVSSTTALTQLDYFFVADIVVLIAARK